MKTSDDGSGCPMQQPVFYGHTPSKSKVPLTKIRPPLPVSKIENLHERHTSHDLISQLARSGFLTPVLPFASPRSGLSASARTIASPRLGVRTPVLPVASLSGSIP